MRPLIVFVDVDDTLVRSYGTKRIPIPPVIEHVRELHRQGAKLYCWSSGGGDYARSTAREFGIEDCFEQFLPKPQVLIDDQDVIDWRALAEVGPYQAPSTTLDDYRKLITQRRPSSLAANAAEQVLLDRLRRILQPHDSPEGIGDSDQLVQVLSSLSKQLVQTEKQAGRRRTSAQARHWLTNAYALIEDILEVGGDLAWLVRLEVLGSLCDHPRLARQALPRMGSLAREFVESLLPPGQASRPVAT